MRSTLTDGPVVAVYLPVAELLKRGHTVVEGTRAALTLVAKDNAAQ